jgi:hypothetical protein
MQIFLTILAGAGAFALGQIVLKLVIDPVHALKVTIADVAHKLILYANLYADPKPPGDEKQEEASREFRILSSKLQSNMYLVPSYKITARVFGLPSQNDIVEGSRNLIFLHNGHDGALANQGILNCYAAQRVRKALGIYIPESEYLNPDHEVNLTMTKGSS